MSKTLKNKYNTPDTLGIISSYPVKGGEIARDNAISRYTYLLSKSFPGSQKVVIFSELRAKASPFEVGNNILIVPTFKHNSVFFANQIASQMQHFNSVKNILVQFEFSIFGGKKIIPLVVMSLLSLKMMGKNVSFILHQVINNLNDLSGHLGIHKYSLKSGILNLSLSYFYKLLGIICNKIIVHDELLKNRLSEHVNENKIIVIPHAVGDENTKVVSAKDVLVSKKYFGFNKKDIVISIYGYRSWYKGTDWLVKTVKEIVDLAPKNNLKLLVAGGVSPTLKETSSYKSFDRKLKKTISKANGAVKVTGFVKEQDVFKVFAVSDVVVFPYRARMSASGAFALTMAYKKPFILSKHFAEGLNFKMKKAVFDLNTYSFEAALQAVLSDKSVKMGLSEYSHEYLKNKEWSSIAKIYIEEVKKAKISLPKIQFLPRFG